MNITKDTFKKLMKTLEDQEKLMDKLYDLGIDTINCEPFYSGSAIFDMLMPLIESEEITDCINAWLYEDCREFSDGNGEWIAMETIDEFYDYLCKR